jgi:hypothetical protein
MLTSIVDFIKEHLISVVGICGIASVIATETINSKFNSKKKHRSS